MEFNLKMVIHRTAAILYFSLFSWLYSGDCSCSITEKYFNETILSYHISILDMNIVGFQPVLYQYELNIVDCQEDLSINVEYKIFSVYHPSCMGFSCRMHLLYNRTIF